MSDKLLAEERKKNNNKKRSKHNVSQTSFGGHNNHTFVAMVFRLICKFGLFIIGLRYDVAVLCLSPFLILDCMRE